MATKALNWMESEWRDCDNPWRMLHAIGETTSNRKLRLHACGCCRQVWSALTARQSREALVIADTLADGRCNERARQKAQSAAQRLTRRLLLQR
jgi:hypothetical protein